MKVNDSQWQSIAVGIPRSVKDDVLWFVLRLWMLRSTEEQLDLSSLSETPQQCLRMLISIFNLSGRYSNKWGVREGVRMKNLSLTLNCQREVFFSLSLSLSEISLSFSLSRMTLYSMNLQRRGCSSPPSPFNKKWNLISIFVPIYLSELFRHTNNIMM